MSISVFLEAFATFRVRDADDKGEHGHRDIDHIRASGGQDDGSGQKGHHAGYNHSFFHIFPFLGCLNSDRDRKSEVKLTAFAGCALDADGAAVGQHDFSRNTQPQPGSLVAACF